MEAVESAETFVRGVRIAAIDFYTAIREMEDGRDRSTNERTQADTGDEK